MRHGKVPHSLQHLVRRRRITLIITLLHDNAAKSPPLAEDFSEEVNASVGV